MSDAIQVVQLATGGATLVSIPPALLPAFKELVFRGTNLWPDAKPEIKDFADVLMYGKPLQDYKGQDTSKEVSPLEQTFMKDSFL